MVCSYEDLNEDEKKTIDLAKVASQDAYAPYSNFKVGAAVLLGNGEFITGNNQENAAYPSGLCAERTALFYAKSQYPQQKVLHIAITAFYEEHFTKQAISPCGACRQVLLEYENLQVSPIKILLYGEKEILIVEKAKDLLPLHFGEDSFLDSSKDSNILK